jgi:hypothetical protein
MERSFLLPAACFKPRIAARQIPCAEETSLSDVIYITTKCDFSSTDCKSPPFVVSRLGRMRFRP